MSLTHCISGDLALSSLSYHTVYHAGGDSRLNYRTSCELSLPIVIHSNYPGLGGVFFPLGCRSVQYRRRRGIHHVHVLQRWSAEDHLLQQQARITDRWALHHCSRHKVRRTEEWLEPCMSPDTLLSIKPVETCLRPVLSADKKQMVESVVPTQTQRSTGDKIKGRREMAMWERRRSTVGINDRHWECMECHGILVDSGPWLRSDYSWP